jgi:phosphoribosylamine---glycine ligase
VKILCIDHGSFMLDWVMRCQDDGHSVRWYTIRRLDTWPGKGLAEFVADWREHMKWADMVVLADNTKYIDEIDAWRDKGILVVGASHAAADWELNRTVGQSIFKKYGVAVASYKEFDSYDRAIAYVKRENRRFVSKPCGDEPDKALSYVAESPADMVYMLERWKKAQRHKGSFILQEFVGGVEMAIGAWFGPHGFNRGWCENFEFKKLMAGECGPATGEMGTVLRYVESSKLADKVLKPIEPALEKIRYVGYVDVNCIVDEDGAPWPLEFTMRPGWPTFNIQQALLDGDAATWLYDLAQGRDARAVRLGEVATGVVLVIPDFPYSKLTRKAVTGIPVYGLERQPNLHPCELMAGSAPTDVDGKVTEAPCMVTAGDYLLVGTGTGDSVRSSASRAYSALKKVQVPNSPFWRPDIGQRLKKQLPILQAHGYAKGMSYT